MTLAVVRAQVDGSVVSLEAIVEKQEIRVVHQTSVMFTCRTLLDLVLNGMTISADDASAGIWSFVARSRIDACGVLNHFSVADK